MKWKLQELRRYNGVLLQISSIDKDGGEQIRGSILTDEDEEGVRILWQRAMKVLNQESLLDS